MFLRQQQLQIQYQNLDSKSENDSGPKLEFKIDFIRANKEDAGSVTLNTIFYRKTPFETQGIENISEEEKKEL